MEIPTVDLFCVVYEFHQERIYEIHLDGNFTRYVCCGAEVFGHIKESTYSRLINFGGSAPQPTDSYEPQIGISFTQIKFTFWISNAFLSDYFAYGVALKSIVSPWFGTRLR